MMTNEWMVKNKVRGGRRKQNKNTRACSGEILPAFGLSDHTRRSDNLKVDLFSWDSFRQSAYVLHHGDLPTPIARNTAAIKQP